MRRKAGQLRGLGAEDRALWDRAVRNAIPLDPARHQPGTSPSAGMQGSAGPGTRPSSAQHPGRSPSPATGPATAHVPTSSVRTRSLRPAGSGKPAAVGVDLAGPTVGPVGRPEAGLDRRLAERLRRGERAPDGRIDLHGMTAERAHRALDRRIGEALARGERLVLVITGKGSKRRSADDVPFMRDDHGVLRQQAPGWLRSGPYARQIVGIYEAPLRHGGGGAFYVYLKKQR